MTDNRFSEIAEATSARLHGEGETVRVRYMPRANGGPAYMRLEYLNSNFAGELVGPIATRLRKQHKLPCREWVTMRLRLEATDAD